MTRIAYLDCPTGISGDMCLGALLDGGVPLDYLQHHLQGLGIAEEFSLSWHKVEHQGQQASKAEVQLRAHGHHHHPPARHWPDIVALIQQAGLPLRAEAWSLAIFRELALAEAAVHGVAAEQVHFHEVGATDALVDIVGTCLGLDWLGIEELYCSALPTGGGTVKAAHGRLPVPVPAVLQLWQKFHVPVYSNGIERELVTPTGAAIAVTLASQFGPPPPLQLEKIGLGAGTQELPLANILRLWIGQKATQAAVPQGQDGSDRVEEIILLETQIDDLNPQAIGYTMEALFAAGAVDVFTQAIGMKKSRPGVLLSVVCTAETVESCETVLFRETTTLGIRRSQQQRRILARQIQTLDTRYGPIRLKIAYQQGKIVNVQPEFEDCAQVAKQQDLPWQQIHQLALSTWYQHQPSP
uniref:Putative nickel insertion protein n=1 Tax=Cyanothece sp. (strain PCC 7425 / ATCC 29141) TaxID=395961 RepID=Y3737_CYAP4|nr:RecName: Full=Putative nickel insertion protein [Cyanothece sp. PCC 7425]